MVEGGCEDAEDVEECEAKVSVECDACVVLACVVSFGIDWAAWEAMF